jgi:hypothetical protein
MTRTTRSHRLQPKQIQNGDLLQVATRDGHLWAIVLWSVRDETDRNWWTITYMTDCEIRDMTVAANSKHTVRRTVR